MRPQPGWSARPAPRPLRLGGQPRPPLPFMRAFIIITSGVLTPRRWRVRGPVTATALDRRVDAPAGRGGSPPPAESGPMERARRLGVGLRGRLRTARRAREPWRCNSIASAFLVT